MPSWGGQACTSTLFISVQGSEGDFIFLRGTDYRKHPSHATRVSEPTVGNKWLETR